jgi:ribosomal protein L31
LVDTTGKVEKFQKKYRKFFEQQGEGQST